MARTPAWLGPAAMVAAVHAALFALTAKGLQSLEPTDIAAVAWSHNFYYENASKAVAGEVPYRDYVFEYPILTFPLFLAPRLLAADLPTFRVLFIAEMFLFDAWAIGLIAARVARRGGTDRVLGRLNWYTVDTLILAPLVIGRFELAPMAIAFAAASWWDEGLAVRGGVAAGLGALTKVFPGLVALPFALREIAGGGLPRARGTMACLAVAAAGALGWLAVGGTRVGESIGYQAARGLEVESTWAGALLLAGKLAGSDVPLVFNYKAYHAAGAWAGRLAAASPALQLAALVLVAWRFRRAGMADPTRFAAAAILAFIVTGKVLSPQFLVWLLPFVAAMEGRIGRRARPLFLVACLTTTLIYPGPGFGLVLEHHLGGILLLNLRNALLLGLLALLLSAPTADGPAPG